MTLQPKRCHRCKREVLPTLHTRDGARVDYYRMVTGPVRVETVEDPRAPGEKLRLLRVVELHEVFTCATCYADPSVRAELEERFRSGQVCE